jgi:hypothetical protein
VIDLSLNEAETLAAKAARGAGFSWGLADEIGRAARILAAEGEDWGEAVLALAAAAQTFEAPTAERVARWRRGERDAASARPLCPVRTAALLLDDAAEIGATPLRIARVGLPIWFAAMLKRAGGWIIDVAEPLAASDVTVRRGVTTACRAGVRRAAIAPQILTALDGYVARTYVPESERSRERGAGGGTVDDD